MQWLNKYRAFLPPAGALVAVLLFWIIGLLGGFGFLRGSRSPLAKLIGLYVMFFLVIASAAVAYGAVRVLRRRL